MTAIRHCSALLVSAASGQGRTTVTAALARYYRKGGRRLRVFKTGPDFRGVCPHGGAVAEPVFPAGRLTASYIHACRPSNTDPVARRVAP